MSEPENNGLNEENIFTANDAAIAGARAEVKDAKARIKAARREIKQARKQISEVRLKIETLKWDTDEDKEKLLLEAEEAENEENADEPEAPENVPAQVEEPETLVQEVALEVKDLYVTYKSMQTFTVKAGLFRKKRPKTEKIQAVKGISFTLNKGNILGIVGKNGSGKSTMLRAIAGIFAPDSGEVDLKGHSISLMSIGVGFNNELSGRENIILSGMLLGFSREAIQEKVPEIIEFSELGEFIDLPVRTYSSGMHSKLAFAITAILETDIMLVDEVLSVGDARFRRKSFRKMRNLIKDKDRTVVIVSHNMNTLEVLCDHILWINDGDMMMYGTTREVLPAYNEFMEAGIAEDEQADNAVIF